MKKAVKWTAALLGGLLLVTGLGYGALRVQDGPVEFFPWFTISVGGPFRTGEATAAPDDWSSVRDVDLIEIQTLSPSSSRAVWSMVVDGRLFIVSGYMSSTIGRLWKQWPTRMEDDNRILMRIDGRLYEQRLDRITEGPEIPLVMAELGRKYFGGSGEPAPGSAGAITGGSAWMFEVVNR